MTNYRTRKPKGPPGRRLLLAAVLAFAPLLAAAPAAAQLPLGELGVGEPSGTRAPVPPATPEPIDEERIDDEPAGGDEPSHREQGGDHPGGDVDDDVTAAAAEQAVGNEEEAVAEAADSVVPSAGAAPRAFELEPAPPVTVGRIAVEGNDRVEEEAIRVRLKTRAGVPLDEAAVDADLRALYGMGFFDDVTVDLAERAGEWVLTFRVDERPLIREIAVTGSKKIDEEELEAAFKIRPNTIYDPNKVRAGIAEAKKLYEKKGYLDASIEPRQRDLGSNQIALTFDVEENKLIRVSRINLEGARAFSQRQLKGILQTKEKWFLSWATGAGNLDSDILKTDTERLVAFYYDNGYIDVKVDEPKVERRDDGLHVTIKIDEGPQFKIGTIGISGDTIPDMTRAREVLSLETGDVFRSSKLRADINALTEVYGDEGYAFVNVNPDTQVDAAAKTVDISYAVSKGPIVQIDKILISGNTKTRDKVVRREIELQEQRRFAGAKLRRSKLRLQRTGFFEDVNITTRKSDQEDQLDLIVDVKEGSTGTFSAGAGISSGETFLFNLRLQEINLLGRGHRLVFNADFGTLRRNISIDFTEPYLFDTEILMGVRAFNWEFEFDDFTRGGTGGTIRFLYPLTALGFQELVGFSLEDTRIGLEYRLEQTEIKDVDQFTSPLIRAEQGNSLISSLTPRIFRDTSNHPFNPTEGSIQDFSVEVAGLGGDARFVKFEGRLRWYFPIWASEDWGTFVFTPGATYNYGIGYDDQLELPLFERYFPGGINSIRGFDILSLGPVNTVTDSAGRVVSEDRIGGSQQFISNNEVVFPIVESLGLRGVVFFDAGNAFSAAQGFEIDEIRLSTGGGIRWMSPIGPLRIELGFPLNAKKVDDEQMVMFSFGGGIR